MKKPVESKPSSKSKTELSDHIKKLIAKDNVPDSVLSRLAYSYTNTTWWVKWGWGGLFSVAGVIFGFLTSPLLFPISAIAGGILGFLSYFIPTRVLKKHHQAERQHQQNIADEMTQLETMLSQSIDEIRSLEKPTRALIASLEEKNKERAESNSLFQRSVDSFKRQAEESHQALQGLIETEQNLARQNEALSLELDQSIEAQKKLTQTQRDIFQVNEELLGAKDSLVRHAEIFHDLASHVEQRNDDLTVLCQKLKKIEADALKTQRAFETHLLTLQQPRPDRTETEEESQQSSQELEESVLRNLEQFLTQGRNRFFKEDTSSQSELNPNRQLTY